MAFDFVVFAAGAAAGALLLTLLFGVFCVCRHIENWVDQYWGDGSIADDWALGVRRVNDVDELAASRPAPHPAAPKPLVVEIFMTSDATPLEYGAVLDHLRFMSDYNLEIVAEHASHRATVRAPVGHTVDRQLLHATLLAVAGDAGVERVSTPNRAPCAASI